MEHRWEPLSLDDTAELLESVSFPWWICGGWAIDLFVGQQTREHGDLEVGALHRDQCALFAALEGFEIHAARDGTLSRLTSEQRDRGLPAEYHGFWCRPHGAEAFALELLLNHGGDGDWIFRRNPTIRRPLEEVVHRTRDGLPYLAPEVQLLFKAKALRARDQHDFEQALPRLSAGARAWLVLALARMHPSHPWADQLA